MTLKSCSVQCLVVDSGAFIKNASIHELGEKIFTVQSAIKEIKDQATRQNLQVLPYKLEIKEPSADAIKYVTEFSKKTGDYSNLSATDLQIIALTYQLEKELLGSDHLNKEPVCRVTAKPTFVDCEFSGFYYPKEKSNAEGVELSSEIDECSENELATKNDDAEPNGLKNTSSEDENEDSDEEGWITPNNIGEVQKKMGSLTLDQASSVSVACLSTDFSIQNVLLQMGLHVLSVDGMLIKQTRIFILRCYACYKTTSIMTKQFCPNCGNQTLKRVAVTVNDDGTKNIHINFRKPINLRGTRYSLPTPKGGKHSTNPVLCEDQPIPHNRPSKFATQRLDAFSPDFDTLSSPFAVNDVYSRAGNLGIRSNKKAPRRRNPNSNSKKYVNKRSF